MGADDACISQQAAHCGESSRVRITASTRRGAADAEAHAVWYQAPDRRLRWLYDSGAMAAALLPVGLL